MDAEQEMAALDREVRRYVYDYTMREGMPPTLAQTAEDLALGAREIRSSFDRLADAHVLVLQEGSGEILMANPFSAVPTPFMVRASGRHYFGNCIWDALGIPAMLGTDGVIESSCGCCGEGMRLEVSGGALVRGRGVAHFAVPAAHWWDDIVYN